jgi:hypothetical protein
MSVISDKSKIFFNKDLLVHFSENELKMLDIKLKQCKFSDITYLIQRELVDKFEDEYSKQILLTIYLFSLLKLQKYDQVEEIFSFYKFNKFLFCYKFLEGKYYYLIV